MSELSAYDRQELLALLLKKKDIAVSQLKIIPKRTETDPCPLSFAQQRLWFLDQLQPASPFYNIPAAYRLLGPLNVEALERSLNEIVRRHDALRTSVNMYSGEPVQLVAPFSPFVLPFEDLRSLPETERDEGLRLLAHTNGKRGFDLFQGPLYRMSLVQMDDEDHVLLLVMHHMICDGWSLGVLFSEVAVFYASYISDTKEKGKQRPPAPAPLPELRIQYTDYAKWQREWLRGEVLEEQLIYWRKQLAAAPVLEMLTDHARPLVQTYSGAAHPVHIAPKLTNALKDLSQREGVTLFMTLLAAFQTLLYRYTGQEDICVGTPIANRNRAEIEKLIGFFVNTVVLRANLSGEPTFREFLQRVREMALDAYAHQDVPFEKLVEELQPERTLSHSPLFQVMFALQNAREETIYLPGLTIKSGGIDSATAKFDLSLLLIETEQGLKGAVEYSTDLFDAATITRLVSHLQNLLAAIVSNVDCPLNDLSLLSAPERDRLLIEWNDTRKPFPQEKCLHELLEEQAARTPAAAAVMCGKAMLTYGELQRRSNRLAHYLRRLGVGPEVRVGIMLERSFEMVVGLLGILKAGGAYVPLDPSYPKERLEFMVEDAGLTVVLTRQQLALNLGRDGVREVCLDAEGAAIARESEANPTSGVVAENLAYVIYTSGSTGTPKGAMNTHRAICNRLLWMQATYQLTKADRVLQKTPFSFDVSVWEFFLPLLAGAGLVMACPGGHRDSEYLVNLIAQQEITMLHFVPSMLQVFLDEKSLEKLTLLKRVICSGEALSLELQERFFSRLGAELHNLYGPTEAAVDVTYWECSREGKRESVPIGRPIWNTQIYILSERQEPVPIGVGGELYIGGEGVGRGYVTRADLTAARFVPDPFSEVGGQRLYRTGDLARYLPGGEVEYLGRLDQQVKLRGYRIELGEIEAVLALHPAVGQAVVVTREYTAEDMRLVAYVVLDQETAEEQPDAVYRKAAHDGPVACCKVTLNNMDQLQSDLRGFLAERLPDYMMPGAIVFLDQLPLTPNGKLDRKALPAPTMNGKELSAVYQPPQTTIERIVAEVWQQVLGLEKIGLYDNFFDLGGHSLRLAQVRTNLREIHHLDVPIIEMFRYPTVSLLANYLSERRTEDRVGSKAQTHNDQSKNDGHERREVGRRKGKKEDQRSDIAIIGMAGRFPGAGNLAEFWDNLRAGVESISTLSDEELRASGADEALLRDPHYIKAGSFLENIEQFDASFFGFNPREAEVTDPQHRIFLECAWEVLENAGYDPQQFAGRIGLFAGESLNSYLYSNLFGNADLLNAVTGFQTILANDRDFLATRVSYKLNLRGPSVVVQSACSTSLVAVHLACQSLLNGESDMALAGGVSVKVPHRIGYRYQESGIKSPDGHCRPFDARAAGTVGGSGVGLVLLKRMADAEAEQDQIYALIKGSAINNDGAMKVGYTAPSVAGQAEVIAEALAVAGVGAESISYVEAHGTATPLGDPVEVAALTEAFRRQTEERGYCGLGSVKSNIGHLDAAAGVTGLIKTVLALQHEEMPASLHYEQGNPGIEFAESPFYVNAELRGWPRQAGAPRRAGVSSFGIGGTNAHVVLEEAPETRVKAGADGGEREREGEGWQALPLSGRTEAAVVAISERLGKHLEQEGAEEELADVAFTLQQGRRGFEYRRLVLARSAAEAAAALASGEPSRVISGRGVSGGQRPVVFLFPGQGAQRVGMGQQLYEEEAGYRREVDECAEVLRPLLGFDLREVLYPERGEEEQAGARLRETEVAQAGLFVTEYAQARLLMERGVRPAGLLGHSVGEYVAACVAGVWSRDEGLRVVAARGRLMQQAGSGAMLSVSVGEEEAGRLVAESGGAGAGLWLAVHNGPQRSVVSGGVEAVAELERRLQGSGVQTRRLETSHAFHSGLMEEVREEFERELQGLGRGSGPQLQTVSNVTGRWLTAEQAGSERYWGRQLREPVRFGAGVEQVLELGGESGVVLVEVGPGRGLTGLARQVAGQRALVTVLLEGDHGSTPTTPKAQPAPPDPVWRALAQVWVGGGQINWPHPTPQQRRLALPTYPFERQHFWIERKRTHEIKGESTNGDRPESRKKADIGDWFYAPIWKQSVLPHVSFKSITQKGCWLLFAHEGSLTSSLIRRLTELGNDVVTVNPGESFERLNEQLYRINHQRKSDYEMLLKEIRQRHGTPRNILHLWAITPTSTTPGATESVSQLQSLGFYSLLFLAQAWGSLGEIEPLRLAVLSNDMQAVVGEERLRPEKATMLGPCKIIPQEYANISCMSLDVTLPQAGTRQETRLTDQLLAEFTAEFIEPVVAYRGGSRWVQRFEPMRIDETGEEIPRLRDHGNYLITGGLGAIALTLAEYLAQSVKARLILLGRSSFPERDEWANWLESHHEDDDVSLKIGKLKVLEQHGAEVLVLSADVTNEGQMRAALAHARERFGEVNGVIHAAGIPGAGIIQLKTEEMAAAVLAPKLTGTLVLERIFAETNLDFLVLCSSTSSILGGAGGVDYCAANAFLNAYAQSKWAQPGAFTVSVGWNKWLEVGMAARFARRSQSKSVGQTQPKPQVQEAMHPMFDLRLNTEPDQHAYLTRFSVDGHWVLNEHRIRGHAVLPGTAYLEMARAAFEEIAGISEIEISDAVFVAPLLVNDEADAEVRTSIHRNGVGYRFIIESKREDEEGVEPQWTAHAVGGINYLTKQSEGDSNLKDLIETCEREGILVAGEGHYRELGPRWHNLKKIYFGEDEGIAALELPSEYLADLDAFKLHPSILDMSTGFLAARVLGEGDYLPFLYRRIRIKASLPRRVYSYVKFNESRDSSKETVSFDVVIANEDGAELVRIEDFRMKRVGSVTSKLKSVSRSNGAGENSGRSILPGVAALPPVAAPKPASGALEGILPKEGADAFSRILLHSAMPQVFVVPQELPTLIQYFNSLKVGSVRREAEQLSEIKAAHPRPDLEQEYIAPRSEVEETIAGIWRAILGIDQIGIDDNFFDLGGDSLIALQLSTRLRDSFRVEPSISSVFDSPTVAGLAVLVAQSAAESVDNELLTQLLNDLEG